MKKIRGKGKKNKKKYEKKSICANHHRMARNAIASSLTQLPSFFCSSPGLFDLRIHMSDTSREMKR